LEAWFQAGHDLRIYSSGSVTAQRLFFEHTTQGNLLNLFRGHFDTTVGPKRATESYRQITHAFGLSPHQIAFLSDVVEELDAAKAAGLLTILCRRPGNPPVNATHCHHEITCFTQLIPLKKRQQR
jgi:enolase-phosphatase E1